MDTGEASEEEVRVFSMGDGEFGMLEEKEKRGYQKFGEINEEAATFEQDKREGGVEDDSRSVSLMISLSLAQNISVICTSLKHVISVTLKHSW